MTLPPDIVARIRSDFPDSTDRVRRDLEAVVERCTNGARVARCVLHLAERQRDKLSHFVVAALQDERDVMWWAEYDGETRVRDFRQPFP